MVSPRTLLASSLMLLSSVARGSPTTAAYNSRSTSTSSHHKATPTTVSSSSSTASASPTSLLCPPEFQGIVRPTNGATINQVNDGNYDATYVEVIYCSGAYFKTSSLDGSLWLASPGNQSPSGQSGQLLIKDQKPNNLDSSAGFYSYRFNASIYPVDGTYLTGQQILSVYETTTGYYNPYDFDVTSINVTFTVENPKSS